MTHTSARCSWDLIPLVIVLSYAVALVSGTPAYLSPYSLSGNLPDSAGTLRRYRRASDRVSITTTRASSNKTSLPRKIVKIGVQDSRLAPPLTELSSQPFLSQNRKKLDCYRIFFFHIEKTGGTTLRRLFTSIEKAERIEVYTQGDLRRGDSSTVSCEGQHGWYSQTCCTFGQLMNELKNDLRGNPKHKKLFVELRASRTIEALRRVMELRSLSPPTCPVFALTLLRNPKRIYPSYYKYFAQKKQERTPEKFGNTFGMWLPQDMQCNIISGRDIGSEKVLLTKTVADAKMRILRAQNQMQTIDLKPFKINGQEFYRGRPVSDCTYERAQGYLNGFDLVGTTSLMDEFLLILSDLTGLEHIVYKPYNVARGRSIDSKVLNLDGLKPRVKGAPPAPDHTAAEKMIDENTKADSEIFNEYEKRFQERVAALGPEFKQRVSNFKSRLQDMIKKDSKSSELAKKRRKARAAALERIRTEP